MYIERGARPTKVYTHGFISKYVRVERGHCYERSVLSLPILDQLMKERIGDLATVPYLYRNNIRIST